jgi:chromate transporter
MLLWNLLWSFIKIGCVSFGGGYAMIPIIEREVLRNHWLTEQQFSHVVSIAGMAPGPVATNTATIVGYETAGIAGAFFAALGTLLPSLAIILAFCYFLQKVKQSNVFEAIFYGLRPIVTGLIIYAGIHFGEVNGMTPVWSWFIVLSVLLVVLSLVALMKFRVHPLLVILASGALGIIFFS